MSDFSADDKKLQEEWGKDQSRRARKNFVKTIVEGAQEISSENRDENDENDENDKNDENCSVSEWK